VVGACPVVSLPPGVWATLSDRARLWSPSLVADCSALAAQLEPIAVEKIVGPAYIGYPTEDTLHIPASPRARQLTESDAEAVARLRAACSPEDWEHGGSPVDGVPAFGAYDDAGELSALAGYETWGGTIAHISIVTAIGRRNRGFARAAVAMAARHALNAGLLPQYRTLVANAPSMRIAERLGFKEYGFSVAVRLAVVCS
jgi:acetyltransferase (GNAT) family protein